jgi:transposase
MAWRRGQPYSQDLRDRVLAATGLLWEVAARFKVSQSYVSRPRSRCKQLGQISPGAQCNHVPLRLGALKDPLLEQVARAPDQTLAELCQWVQVEHGIRVGPTTMGKTLARFGLTLKKEPPCQRTDLPRSCPSARCLECRATRTGVQAIDLS